MKRLLLAGTCLAALAFAAPEASADSFSYTGGVQTYLVPVTGEYDITVIGATGGDTVFGCGCEKLGLVTPNTEFQEVVGFGGYGAGIAGEVLLTQGQMLNILVGGQGGTGYLPAGQAAGGGGGSFVTDASNNPLIVAGGGGGAGVSNGYADGGNATLSRSGGSGSGSGGGAGGTGGSGGKAGGNPNPTPGYGYAGAGGGGFSGNGQGNPYAPNAYTAAAGGKSFANGSYGGSGGGGFNGSYGQSGGFGGGGGAGGGFGPNGFGGGGGGGGFSGGGGGGNYYLGLGGGGGGGGGSYAAPAVTVVYALATANPYGDGYVSIVPDPSDTPVPEPASAGLLAAGLAGLFASRRVIRRRRR